MTDQITRANLQARVNDINRILADDFNVDIAASISSASYGGWALVSDKE